MLGRKRPVSRAWNRIICALPQRGEHVQLLRRTAWADGPLVDASNSIVLVRTLSNSSDGGGADACGRVDAVCRALWPLDGSRSQCPRSARSVGEACFSWKVVLRRLRSNLWVWPKRRPRHQRHRQSWSRRRRPETTGAESFTMFGCALVLGRGFAWLRKARQCRGRQTQTEAVAQRGAAQRAAQRQREAAQSSIQDSR